MNLKPEKDKDLQAFSLSGPTDTVGAAGLAVSAIPFQEKVVINRVEFADGKNWMRKDWNAGEIHLAHRATAETLSPSRCLIFEHDVRRD